MKNNYEKPTLNHFCLSLEDCLNASGGTYGTIGDYDGDFVE